VTTELQCNKFSQKELKGINTKKRNNLEGEREIKFKKGCRKDTGEKSFTFAMISLLEPLLIS
jgi:hypothetical protein